MSVVLIKNIPLILKKKWVSYIVISIMVALVFFGFFYIIYKQNFNTTNRFNQQVRGLARTSTTYLANNYDLYGSPLTIKFQNIVKDFLNENGEVTNFQIFNTDGSVLFDSVHPNSQTNGSVSDQILDLSRNNVITSVITKNRIRVLVSPYFEEWGTHKYSLLFYPSYVQVDKDNWRFSLELGIIAILSVAVIVAIALLFILNERYKVHLEEKARLEVLDRQRQEFMVLVAHNLRTPVTVIQGYLSLLSEMEIPEIQKELVEPIGEASQNLYLLIEQILTITTVLGQRDLVISKEKLKLSDIIANIIKEYQSKIEEKKLSVSQNYIPKNINIFANRRYIELIFMALIENAIKFNKAGGAIKIDGKLEGDNTILAISDTGIGIAKTEQDRVFAGFHKADTHESVYDFNYKGTGLGLYTSKILVDAFGGNIWFESDEGKCSTFYISLPNFQEPSSKQSTNTAQNDTASQIN